MYEKLFGGFEDLAATAIEDEEEEDELENVPQKYKTKQGYLKDGFVVDGSDSDDDDDEEYCSEDDDTEELSYKNNNTKKSNKKTEKYEEEIIIEDIGSELSEDSYDYN
jgi:hypothetical protein